MIYTVRGAIAPSELGLTLSHEHIKWENDECHANSMYFDKKYKLEEIESDTELIGMILKDIKRHGCQSIVEASPPIGGQNVKLLKALSDRWDMHILPCTGWNITKQLYNVFPDHFEEQLAKRWIDDFQNGLDIIDGILIRPAYIKLLLDRGNLSNPDRAMLTAAVRASKATGMPIHCHILEAKMLYEVVMVLDEEKADYDKFLWAHADEESNREAIIYAAEKGIWIGIDNIRRGKSQEKYELLSDLIKLGYQQKVILSQDYDFYEEAKKSIDTHPCTVLFEEFIPYCVENGTDETMIIEMMTKNPAQYYNIE